MRQSPPGTPREETRSATITPETYTDGFTGSAKNAFERGGRFVLQGRHLKWQGEHLPPGTMLTPFVRNASGVIFLIPSALLNRNPHSSLQTFSPVNPDNFNRRVVMPEVLRSLSGIGDNQSKIMITGHGPYVALHRTDVIGNSDQATLTQRELQELLHAAVYEKLPRMPVNEALAAEPAGLQERITAMLQEVLGISGGPVEFAMMGVRVRANVTFTVNVHVDPVAAPSTPRVRRSRQ